MGTQRKSKRQLIRDEKRKKKRDRGLTHPEDARESKRQRLEQEPEPDPEDEPVLSSDDGEQPKQRGSVPEREFFGMLTDEEQEYFRRADEMLELNDFPSPEQRSIFLENVYKEAQGKELKLASSQSCSRLMERLMMLSTVKQKKHLFEAFASHFVSLVTHRFASHCCEQLFLQSAPIVTLELRGSYTDEIAGAPIEEEPQASMEELFLLTLDEFEGHLSYLLSDKFASHSLRVLLIVLSGRPLEQVITKSLLQSKKKEHITVAGAHTPSSDELNAQLRAVPESFTLSIRKIITDSTSTMDATALRVLASHPTGNPVLQLLLELDIALNAKRSQPEKSGEEQEQQSLLEKLLPDAPLSLNNTNSQASDFVNSMLYDPIGSRLLETLIAHSPGKIFKGLHTNFFGPRIHSFLRNDIASYPAIKVLIRLSKQDLIDAVHKTLEIVPLLIQKGRFNVLKTLFERCAVREAREEIDLLLKSVCDAYGSDSECLIPKLCFSEEESSSRIDDQLQFPKNKAAAVSHGCHLSTALLGLPGSPSRAIQASLLSLPSEKALHLAMSSTPAANVLIAALKSPSRDPIFHKSLVATLSPHIIELAGSQFGHNVLIAVITTPSKGDGIAVPFHLKESLMTRLAEHEQELRDSWTGRSVWRAWKGDVWKRRRVEWIHWAKEVDPEWARTAMAPQPRAGRGRGRHHGGLGFDRTTEGGT